VYEVFADEREHLLGLPDNPFPCEEREETTVKPTPYVRFDGNDYSVPHTAARRSVVVYATLDGVRIVDGVAVIATHPRSWDKGAVVEVAEHVAALVAWKRAARHHRGLDRLHHACPSADAFFRAAAARQANLGALTTGLTTLLDGYGAPAVEAALAGALTAQAPHLAAVRQLLEQHRQAHRQPPPIPVALPADARVRDLVVQPHALTTYDDLHADRKEPDDDATAH
jgi:hypothetical protein